MKTVAINKGGRSPRPGVNRYQDGSIVRSERRPLETEEDAKATVLEARMRRDLGVDAWMAARGSPQAMREARKRMDEPYRESAFGKLLLIGRRDAARGIRQEQFEAGQYFVTLYGFECRRNGSPSPNIPAINYGDKVGGLSTEPEDSPQWVAEMRRRWLDMYGAILDAQRDFDPIFESLKRILIENGAPQDLREVGSLRVALNAINRARGL